MGMYTLATLVSVWLVCTGAHVIDKRQDRSPTFQLCRDNFVSIGSNAIIDVESPQFGNGNYQDNTRCSLVLQSRDELLALYVRYRSFDLEYQQECGFDSLCMGGNKLCGNWLAEQAFDYILPANSNFTLDFKTDGSVTGRGFLITIYPSFFLGDYIFTPVGGVGSSNSSLELDVVNNFSNYSITYQDKCKVDTNGGNWNSQTSPNYNTDYPWYYQTSPNYYTDYPWYYQTSPNYYTDYPYYYNTSPDRRQDTTFLRYFLYEALSALGEANYNSEAAIQSLQRAITYLEGNAGGKK